MYRRGINFGCRNLLINYPELVSPLKTAEPQFFQDCDTPEAYRDVLALFDIPAAGREIRLNLEASE